MIAKVYPMKNDSGDNYKIWKTREISINATIYIVFGDFILPDKYVNLLYERLPVEMRRGR